VTELALTSVLPDSDSSDVAVIPACGDCKDSVVSQTSTGLVPNQRIRLPIHDALDPFSKEPFYQVLLQIVTGLIKNLLLPVNKREPSASICATPRVIIT